MQGKACVEPRCKKLARCMSDKCWTHALQCVEPGCIIEVNIKGEMCWKHKQPRCTEHGCNTTVWNNSSKCREHHDFPRCLEAGCKTMVDKIGNKCREHGGGRCEEPHCKNWAVRRTPKIVRRADGNLNFVYDEEPNNKCSRHGGGDRCVEPGCNKGAAIRNGALMGEPRRCVSHGGGNRCTNCITWPDSRSGSVKYDGYCATCFKHLFPNDERSKVVYIHTKEIRVRNKINEVFEGFIHDKPLYTGQCDCTMRRRIDHRKLIGATLLCVETDEFAHKGYDPKDEEIRYDDLFMVHSGKWVFIRFNPDGKGVDMDDKLSRLVEEIHIQIKRIENEENSELLEVVKLFY